MKTLIILHGWQSSKERWQKVADILAQNNIKIIVPDLPGFKPETELSKPWTFSDYSNWVEKFIESQNIDGKFYLLGHSFGGALALDYALKNPYKVEKLFLNAAACIRRKSIKKWFLGRVLKVFKIFSFLPFFNFARKAFYKFVVGADDYLGTKGNLKQTFLNVISEDFSSRLEQIKAPTVIIWGQNDKATLIDDAYFINKIIKNSKLEIIPGKGHSLQIEAPEFLAQKIIENLN